MSRFVAAVNAEFTKVLSTRMWWLLGIVLLGYVAFTTAIVALGFGGQLGETEGAPGLPAAVLPPLIYSFASSIGYVFPLLVGALAVTNEFRHQTLTPTFLATPRRAVVLGSKLLTMFFVGAFFGVLGLVASVGLGSIVLNAMGVDPALGDPDTWALIARVLLAMALWGAIGVGIGVLIPSQVGSIVVVLAFTQFVEPILRTVASFVEWLASVGRFLPGAAGDALVGASFYSVLGEAATESLEWWQGGLVLVALALVFAIAGYFVSWRRDVT